MRSICFAVGKTIQAHFWCMIALLILATPTVSAQEPSWIPKQFTAYIGGGLSSSFKVELKDGVLFYSEYQAGIRKVNVALSPTNLQWREFRLQLDHLKIWQWKKDYPCDTADGTQWSLDIAYTDRTLKTKGDNNYPGSATDSSGFPIPAKEFSGYLRSVRQLIGGRPFE